MALVIHSGLCPLQRTVRRLDIISSHANATIPRDKSDTHCTCPLPSNSLQTSAKNSQRAVRRHRRATLFQYLTVWKNHVIQRRRSSESRAGESCPSCAIQSLVQHRAQVFGCVRLGGEWSESASKPLDIESQQLRAPLRLPSRFGDRAFYSARSWLAGWMT